MEKLPWLFLCIVLTIQAVSTAPAKNFSRRDSTWQVKSQTSNSVDLVDTTVDFGKNDRVVQDSFVLGNELGVSSVLRFRCGDEAALHQLAYKETFTYNVVKRSGGGSKPLRCFDVAEVDKASGKVQRFRSELVLVDVGDSKVYNVHKVLFYPKGWGSYTGLFSHWVYHEEW